MSENVKSKFSMPTKKLVTILICLGIIVLFWFLPAPEPMTQIGMKVLGIFIGSVLMLSLVNTVWPVLLAVVLLSRVGMDPLNAIIAGSFGNWVIYFILMSFLLTHALEQSGFISRIVGKFMSMKFVTKTPWISTFSLSAMGMILAAFIDQVPATAFMLAFANTVYEEMGYEKGDSYPVIANIATVFGVIIGGAATPISHPLALIGLGVYESITGEAISMLQYLVLGVPTAILVFIVMCIVLRIFAKPDFSKFENLNIDNIVKNQSPMEIKEKTIVTIFFLTVIMWMLPGVWALFDPTSPVVAVLNTYGITFWAICAVILLSVIHIDDEPILDIVYAVNHNINWAILIFISIALCLGSAVSNPATGISDYVVQNVTPLAEKFSPIIVVMLFVLVTCSLTNFASNVTSITVMTGVAVTLAIAGTTYNAPAIALAVTFAGSCAYTLPSGFAPIAMLHGNEYSNSSQIYKFGIIMIIVTTLLATFVGYNIASLI